MAAATIQCIKCGIEKPVGEFYLSRGKPTNKCKSCTREDIYTYRENNPMKVYETRLATCLKNPSGVRARRVIEAALAAGVIERPSVCSGCGCSDAEHRIEAHHHDYSKPLDVIWLCTPCHRRMDAERRKREGKKAAPRQRAVIAKKDGRIVARFDSIAEAARSVNRKPNAISGCLAGKCKTSAGLEWEYAD